MVSQALKLNRKITFENFSSDKTKILPAILRLHPTNVGVDLSIGRTSRFGVPPARLATMPSRLAILFIRTHHTLSANHNTIIKSVNCYATSIATSIVDIPASQQLHLASVLVHVAVATADRSVLGRLFAINRTIFPVRTDVVARPQMRQPNTESVNLIVIVIIGLKIE